VTSQRALGYSRGMRSMVVILAGALLGAGCTRSSLQVRSLPAAAQAPIAALEPTNELSPAPAPPPEFPLALASPLDCAIEAARKSGKPVLVIVTGPDVRAQRGRWLADWMDLGEERFTAHLPLAEIAYATRAQLRGVLPQSLATLADTCEVGVIDVLDPEPRLRVVLTSDSVLQRAASLDAREYGSQQHDLELSICWTLSYDFDRKSRARRRSLAYKRFSHDERSAMELALKRHQVSNHEFVIRGAWWYLDEFRYLSWRVWDDFAAAQSAVFATRAPFGARWALFDGSSWSIQFEPQDDERERNLLQQRAPELSSARLIADRSQLRDGCSSGPCGTGFSGEISYAFLDEYTRVLVDATDLD